MKEKVERIIRRYEPGIFVFCMIVLMLVMAIPEVYKNNNESVLFVIFVCLGWLFFAGWFCWFIRNRDF